MATAKEKLIASATKLVEKGAFEKAIKEYLRVVQEDDSDVRIWLKIGDLYAKTGKKQEATDTYQRVAQFYSDQGFYLKSVAVYKQILKLEPRLVDVNQRLAELYKQLGLISDAISQYEQVASFFHKENRIRDALSAMKQIVDLDPETVAARIKLAEMYSREQMPREAIDEFTRAAEQLKEQGRVDEYMKVAERLLFHAPDNRPVTKELARLYIDKNDPRRALPKLQVLFKADPRDLDVLRLLARAFEGLEQRPKAVSVYKELARILTETGDQRGALDVWRQIQAIQPDDAEAEAALKGQKAGSGPLRPNRKLTPPPIANQSGQQRALQPSGPARAHATGAERALDSGGHRSLREVPTRPGDPRPGDSRGSSLREQNVPEPDGSDDVVGEEIAKILSETDVYIKYNLHAKAIEHLQRVFERAPRNVPAREKLKALYITTGKKDEAILELWALAESAEQGRARRYIREIYELDPSNARAAQALNEPVRAPGQSAHADEADVADDFGVAPPSDFGLPVSGIRREEPATRRARAVEPEAVEEEIDEIDFEEDLEADPIEAMPDSNSSSFESIDLESGADEAEEDLIPVVIDTGEARRIAAEQVAVDDQDRFSLDADDISSPTQRGEPEPEPEPEPVRRAAQRPAGYEASGPDEATRFAGPAGIAELESAEAADDPLGDFDDAEGDGTAQMNVSDLARFEHEESSSPVLSPLASAAEAPATDQLDAIEAAELGHAESSAPSFASSASTRRPIPVPEPIRAESNLEDDLDESDFFMQQSLFDEARSMLEALLERYPAHPLVTAKLRELEAMQGGEAPQEHDDSAPLEPMSTDSALSAQLPTDLPGATDAGLPGMLDSDVNADSVPGAPIEQDHGAPVEVTRRGVIERGVSAEDFETHYDLGIAYKEMGLIDAAIAEFRIVMKDPVREVQCQLMIGLCHIERQAFTEAINQFKKGLYVEGITDAEALSLYYELGQAYEHVGDPREALYYYDKVQKREPKFRDLQKRMRALRGEETDERPPQRSDDLDAAFDSLLDEG